MRASKLPPNPKKGINTIFNHLFNSPARGGAGNAASNRVLKPGMEWMTQLPWVNNFEQTLTRKRTEKRRGYWVSYFFFAMAMKLSIGMAGRVVIFTVPRDPSSRETRAIASLSGASTTLTKS